MGCNLANICMERTNTIYKDHRFWLILCSLAMLVYLTVKSYMAR
jgi:hypothetical protein